MDGHVRRAPLCVAGGPAVRIVDHQMAVERDGGDRAQGGHRVRRERQVGDEVVVHDIDVQPVGMTLDRTRGVGDPPEIGGQQARVDLRGCHTRERIDPSAAHHRPVRPCGDHPNPPSQRATPPRRSGGTRERSHDVENTGVAHAAPNRTPPAPPRAAGPRIPPVGTPPARRSGRPFGASADRFLWQKMANLTTCARCRPRPAGQRAGTAWRPARWDATRGCRPRLAR